MNVLRTAIVSSFLTGALLAQASEQLDSSGQSASSVQSAKQNAANYARRLVAKIKPNIVVVDPVPKEAVAEVEIRTEPSGRISSYRLTLSSGVKAWDEAVVRAVAVTEQLPLDTNGTIPPLILVAFRAGER